MKPLLQIENLSLSFVMRSHTVYAVRGVDLALYPGETIGLVGESGCGKSLTAKAILGLINSPNCRIDSGRILYGDTDLLKLSPKALRRVRGNEIGMIFQDPMTSLNPTMKIGKQIVESITTHEGTKLGAHTKAIELLKLVGISQPELRFHQYPHELSGGMRQRVMIAIALAPSPKILIADEVTTALDVTVQAQILALLTEIQEKTGTSILFITHDLSLVASCTKRVLVMYAGKIVEEATTEELFASPSHPYTTRLLASIPRIDDTQNTPLIPIEGMPPKMTEKKLGCAFAERCPSAMNICLKQTPPHFTCQTNHKSACWLHDPRAQRKTDDNETTRHRRETEKVLSP